METISFDDLNELEVRNRTRKAAGTIYHVVCGRPESDIRWDDKAPTASHSLETHETTFTENILPPEARSRPFLRLEMLEGAAAHEAGHDMVSETFEFGDYRAFLREPLAVNGVSIFTPRWRKYVAAMRQTFFLLGEDIHVNDWLALRWGETYGRLFLKVARWMRLDWLEHIRWQVRWYEAVARAAGPLRSECLELAFVGVRRGLSTTDPKQKVLQRAHNELWGEYEKAGGTPDGFEQVIHADLISLLTSAFKVWFVYRPTSAEIEAEPDNDLPTTMAKLWDLMAQGPEVRRLLWPGTSVEFLDLTDSLKKDCRRMMAGILGSQFKSSAKTVGIYRHLTKRYFEEVCRMDRVVEKDTKGAEDSASSPAVSPEEGEGPPGTSKARERAEREERKIRKDRADSGDETANEQEEKMGASSPDPLKVIEDYIRRNPARAGAQALKPVVRDLRSILKGG